MAIRSTQSALRYLSSRVPDFAGYDDERARRLADEQIRAPLGVALSRLRARLEEELPGESAPLFDRLLLACQFVDQESFTRFEHAVVNDDVIERIASCDRALIELADRADEIDGRSLPRFLADVQAAFAQRSDVTANAAESTALKS